MERIQEGIVFFLYIYFPYIYIYIYIYKGHSIKKVNFWVIGCTVYNWSFYHDIYVLSSWPALPSLLIPDPGTFSLPEIQCISPSWTAFSTQTLCNKSLFNLSVNIFFNNNASVYTAHILQEISHGLHFSATTNLMTDLCSILEYSVQFDTI